jgi:hypothetical protein
MSMSMRSQVYIEETGLYKENEKRIFGSRFSSLSIGQIL